MFDAKASQADVEIDLIIRLNLRIRVTAMPKTFKIDEQVRWNSEAGRSPADPTTSKEIQRNHWDDKAVETMTNDERIQREANLIATIRMKLPDFAKMCGDDTEPVFLHQDAFAADYQEDEYMLLGMAIKYAGPRNKEVRVIGKNRTTLGDEDTIQ